MGIKWFNGRDILRQWAAIGCGLLVFCGILPMGIAADAPQSSNQNYAIFSINVHDFAYPDLSIATLRRILALHEQHQIPVDFYLTTTMTDILLTQAPDLWERMKQSPVASVCYHARPPTPYYTRYDWLGLRSMTPEKQREIILRYETHGLDLITGQTTSQSGGYQKLKDLLGYPPIVVSAQADAEASQAVADVFKQLGARIFVIHGRPPNLGDQLQGIPLRPEQVDLKLFEHPREDAAALIESAFKEARQVRGARPPYFVGIKMHDNDFFAQKSAWTVTYIDSRRRPPWDLSAKAALRPEPLRQAMWDIYTGAVAYAAKAKAHFTSIGAPALLEMLKQPAPTAQPNSAGQSPPPRLFGPRPERPPLPGRDTLRPPNGPKAAQPVAPTATQLKVPAPLQAGATNAPLLFCIGVHVEPFGAVVSSLAGGGGRPRPAFGGSRPSYETTFFFQKHVADLKLLAEIAERYQGKMTIQLQTPFSRKLVETDNRLLAELEAHGHEIALHFHENSHLGQDCDALLAATWTAVMKEEIGWLKKAGATRIRYWSGGNLYSNVLTAAAAAGLDVMSDYKNPRTQQDDERLLGVNPWRPAAGPVPGNLAGFARHDSAAKITYLPNGSFDRTDHSAMRRSADMGGDYPYFDALTHGLELSLKAARADRINVFHITVHAGEFRGGPQASRPFAVMDDWLAQIIAPLVKAGKVRWATFSEMAEAYRTWEQSPSKTPSKGESGKP